MDVTVRLAKVRSTVRSVLASTPRMRYPSFSSKCALACQRPFLGPRFGTRRTVLEGPKNSDFWVYTKCHFLDTSISVTCPKPFGLNKFGLRIISRLCTMWVLILVCPVIYVFTSGFLSLTNVRDPSRTVQESKHVYPEWLILPIKWIQKKPCKSVKFCKRRNT